MPEVYSESSKLREIIESQGWHLCDVSSNPEFKKRSFKWSDLELQGTAEEFLMGDSYVLAPIPEENQSQRDAYAITKGFGPSLFIPDPDDDRWITLEVHNYLPERKLFFSRLIFFEEGLAATQGPPRRDFPNPSLAGIRYSDVIDTFENYFRVILPEEQGLTTPIPMPFYPEDN